MKNLILCCLACVSLISLAACSDSDKHTMTTSDQSASMQTDTKDMHPVQH
jgi:major membrane immunogen (membrane-anchored lipoprotein)